MKIYHVYNFVDATDKENRFFSTREKAEKCIVELSAKKEKQRFERYEAERREKQRTYANFCKAVEMGIFELYKLGYAENKQEEFLAFANKLIAEGCPISIYKRLYDHEPIIVFYNGDTFRYISTGNHSYSSPEDEFKDDRLYFEELVEDCDEYHPTDFSQYYRIEEREVE